MFDDLYARFGDAFREKDSFTRYTVARLGGTVDATVRVKHTEDLIWLIQWANQQPIPWRIVGGGANVLPSDKGYHGLMIINQTNNVQIDAQTGIVTADSGVNLTTLARRCMSEGLKGFEWAISVPGTIGGAVVNNAGAHGGDIAGNLLDARVLTLNTPHPLSPSPSSEGRGNEVPPSERSELGEGFRVGGEVYQNADFEYAYRHSKLKGQAGRYVVLSARLQLEPGHHPTELTKIAEGFVAHRKKTQPPGASLGSMFKNPPGDYAGRLIEAAGLKGSQIGGVQISPVHGNFFVNVGHGTAADYNALIELAQKTVFNKFGIALELEIERIGDW